MTMLARERDRDKEKERQRQRKGETVLFKLSFPGNGKDLNKVVSRTMTSVLAYVEITFCKGAVLMQE